MTAAPPPRYHHLDALRAFAMLLGIALHALLAFFQIPVWPVQDTYQHQAYETAEYAIHGFRMALFFLISGYFTTMLWQRRGTGSLVLHRLKRILLPLAAGWIAFVPLTIAVSIAGQLAVQNRVLAEKVDSGASKITGDTLWSAAASGNTGNLQAHLDSGIDINRTDENHNTALNWATLTNQPTCARLLLRRGADPNAIDSKGNSALHSAVFLGRVEIGRMLVEYGADVNQISFEGNTPLGTASTHWIFVELVAGMLALEVDHEEVMRGRAELVASLEEQGATGLSNPAIQLYRLGAMAPLFLHLWFLYYILLLVAAFIAVTWILGRLRCKRPPDWLLSSRYCLLYLVPITALAQYFMLQSFGADTAMGPLPWPPKILYYGVFFGFGALCFGRPEFEDKAGRWWFLWFLAAIPVFFFALHHYEMRSQGTHSRLVYSLAASLYAWLMILGCLGFFRRFFSGENPRIRFVSDASYWIYLAHLPLVVALQLLVMNWQLPSFVKFLAVCAITYGILLLLYRYLVRYTWIGTMLNGRKVKAPAPPQSTA